MYDKQLSILIPTYDYSVLRLVQDLHNQISKTIIAYEILCFDDASPLINSENQFINNLANCTYKILPQNIGRSAIRNLLAQTAKYPNLLFLDADTLPRDDNFLEKYITLIDDCEKVVYGGIVYQDSKPQISELLRWVYGNSREALPAETRNKAKYLSMLTLNFMISKSIFEKITFNEKIPNLRHEDTVFSYNLLQANIDIKHVNNPVYHLGLEDSRTFLKKSEESVINLNYLISNKFLPYSYVSLSKYYVYLKKMYLSQLIVYGFTFCKNMFIKNLLGQNPSMFVFDLYRLGYYFSLYDKK